MIVFLSAGILYLLGVAAILALKPEFMFTPDGQWKEFGIGQNPDRYTPFPFWLFCIAWALVSYGIALLLPFTKSEQNSPFKNLKSIYKTSSVEDFGKNSELESFVGEEDFATKTLPKGIYILNKRATKLSGVPKYVYIGDE